MSNQTTDWTCGRTSLGWNVTSTRTGEIFAAGLREVEARALAAELSKDSGRAV